MLHAPSQSFSEGTQVAMSKSIEKVANPTKTALLLLKRSSNVQTYVFLGHGVRVLYRGMFWRLVIEYRLHLLVWRVLCICLVPLAL